MVAKSEQGNGPATPSISRKRMEMRRRRLRGARPTTADHQLDKRQRFDQFVESVPYQKLSGPVSPPFHSPKSHWFSVRAGATETDRGNSNAVKSLVGLKGARDGTQSYGCLARGCEERKGSSLTESTSLHEAQYSFGARFEDGVGTNPEELLAAAHAPCFAMAVSSQLGKVGLMPARLDA